MAHDSNQFQGRDLCQPLAKARDHVALTSRAVSVRSFAHSKSHPDLPATRGVRHVVAEFHASGLIQRRMNSGVQGRKAKPGLGQWAGFSAVVWGR
jgi:hypothetical protein